MDAPIIFFITTAAAISVMFAVNQAGPRLASDAIPNGDDESSKATVTGHGLWQIGQSTFEPLEKERKNSNL
jgi:hypothetical protein